MSIVDFFAGVIVADIYSKIIEEETRRRQVPLVEQTDDAGVARWYADIGNGSLISVSTVSNGS